MSELEPSRDVALFAGATGDEIISVAADVARQFSDVVKKQRMFKRIGQNDHVLIEGWQTIGALTGVLATSGQVTELPWPSLSQAGMSDEDDGTHDHYDALIAAQAVGRAYGFKAEFTATKGGIAVGWGEGRCTRGEAAKVSQDDYALASMAQTRAQSRALGAPLKFVVKLAGYATTPAEELDGDTPAAAEPPPGWGPVADDKQEAAMAAAIKQMLPDVQAEQFVLAIGQNFDGVPVAVVTAFRGLAKFVAATGATS